MRYWVLLLLSLSSLLPAEEVSEKLLLITGCARSGTRYATYVLRDCSLDMGHEWVMEDGCVSWLMAANADECPWQADPSNNFKFQHVFHQVRNPLKVIASVFVTEPPQSWDYIRAHLPQINDKDLHIVKCAKYWYYWNLMAESKAEYTYRVEDIANALPEMSKILGIELVSPNFDTFAKDLNTRGKPPVITWKNLEDTLPHKLFRNIQMLAIRYGYSIKD